MHVPPVETKPLVNGTRAILGGLCVGTIALVGFLWSRGLTHDSTPAPIGGGPTTLTMVECDGVGPNNGKGWHIYMDTNNLGTKVNPFVLVKDGSPAGFKGHGHFFGNVGRAQAEGPWPWAVLEIPLGEKGPKDLSACKALRFYVKGDGKKYRVRLDRVAVADSCHFETTFVAPTEWTIITAPLSDFKQPTWGKQIARSFTDAKAITFTAPGEYGPFDLRFTGVEFITDVLAQR